ncbi:hypothetical protein I7I51_00803 [Histoplasma capsulatum]|uniref:Uncharacterized protein n=1 Tax=Ajellomyces capsulatus TaxID=5037 RepID=A0A8A1MGF0_AJECA|nr:hypothetical protein I7I51_00803 [Histoplasma capsulatum]
MLWSLASVWSKGIKGMQSISNFDILPVKAFPSLHFISPSDGSRLHRKSMGDVLALGQHNFCATLVTFRDQVPQRAQPVGSLSSPGGIPPLKRRDLTQNTAP